MVEVLIGEFDRRDGWVGLSSAREITREPWSSMRSRNHNEIMRSYERKEAVCLKKDLTQPTLLERDLYVHVMYIRTAFSAFRAVPASRIVNNLHVFNRRAQFDSPASTILSHL